MRLALEDAGADYVDVARGSPDDGHGIPAMMAFLDGEAGTHPPFAPPFLKDGSVVIGQTANILLYLGGRLGLAPRDEAGRLWTHQIQLTITDLVAEAYCSHHPIDDDLYFHEQKAEAMHSARVFRSRQFQNFWAGSNVSWRSIRLDRLIWPATSSRMPICRCFRCWKG